ncbi:hypothetical protein [Hufsiella ginkgonis]|uniref:Uncharacterized protein n=1 Tax=Hufsiella ginkgonis TaxID=2695274 RepID=A0A7K1Y0R8_9SPHI|nr:hypothetical protein [Hufsiella ginkgonis]MXV16821.1 hypothetical protein [Hufsiella ginkgonis]
MNVITRIFNNKTFLGAVPWISFITGLLLFLFGTFANFDDDHFAELWSGLGKTMLAGALFALMLKSIQFMGVFKEELIEIIYDVKYLRNRVDLPEYWEKITKELLKNKFPAISQKVTKDVKEIYLPTTSVQYYDNYKQHVSIKVVDDAEDIVEVIQKTRFTIIPVEPNETFVHQFENTIHCGDCPELVNFEILKFKVNEKEQHVSHQSSFENKRLKTRYEVTLSGKSGYNIEMVVKKRYPLRCDNIIGAISSYIRHNFMVQFLHAGLTLDFIDIGTLQKFKTNNESQGFLEKEYQGILYPKQGYIAIIKKIK